ncbi:hypothetical protein CASFOL_021657 [Castilleja foliolosa]|uniref:Uncharacterized protein n=1 Tax=Castilleja foliolosa TaxID=1961234 RepID=A0ABD3CX73_9LAMI
MVSLEEPHQTTSPKPLIDPTFSSPRISFSSDFLDESNFISIHPNRVKTDTKENNNNNFSFLSGISSNMPAADELFSEGKLLPFWQTTEKLNKITLKPSDQIDKSIENKDEIDRRMSWFLDDDPSPRPPKCTVLWKELLRLKKQRASTLSPSSSSSSSSSSGSLSASSGDERKKEKILNRVKRGIERTKSASIRIRPIVNVPICTHGKNSSLPPLFPLRRKQREVIIVEK